MRHRWLLLAGLLIAADATAADTLSAQEQSSFRFFQILSGGQSAWRRDDIRDPQHLEMFERIAQRLGVTNGQISRDQYDAYLQMRRTERASSPDSTQVPAEEATARPSTRGIWENWADSSFTRLDRNGDGLLSFAEMPQGLQDERRRWDRNGNGFVDLNEYQSYFLSRRQKVLADAGRSESQSDSERAYLGGAVLAPRQPRSEEAAPSPAIPAAMLATLLGKGPATASLAARDPPPVESDAMAKLIQAELPSGGNIVQPTKPAPSAASIRRDLGNGVPDWFLALDRDQDRQIGLYEWRYSGRPLEEFRRLDRNDDGFVTIAELNYYLALQNQRNSRIR